MDCTCSIATINGLYIPLPSDMDSSCVDIDMPVCHCVRAHSPHMSISISPAQAIPELPEPPQLSPSLRPVTRLADRQPILDRTILSMPTKRPWSGLIELPTLTHRSSSGRHTLSQLFTSRRSGPASGGRSHSSSSPVYLVRAPAPIRCCFMSMSSTATSPADNIRRPLPRRPGARPACEDPDTTLAR